MWSPLIGRISRKGSREFFGPEVYEFILWAERLGLDLFGGYCTNIDTHLHSERILQHNAFISLGHDEYYSTCDEAQRGERYATRG